MVHGVTDPRNALSHEGSVFVRSLLFAEDRQGRGAGGIHEPPQQTRFRFNFVTYFLELCWVFFSPPTAETKQNKKLESAASCVRVPDD